MFFTALSMAGQVAGGLISAVGSYRQGQQAKENAENEADSYDAAADEERAARAVESGDERIQSARKASGMEARYAKSGLDMAGTPLYAMMEQAKADEFNILSRDRVSRIRADDMNYQGQLLRYQGNNALKASKISAFSSLLGSATNAAGTGMSYRNSIGSKSPLGSVTTPQSYRDASAGVLKVPQMDTLGSIAQNGML